MKKKKGFVIDKITEDTFYENILLGLPHFLKSSQFVSQAKFDRFPAASLETIQTWESRNIELPEDIHDLFLSTNGFHFSYKFDYVGNDEADCKMYGKIDIKPLNTITQMNTSQIMCMSQRGPKYLNPTSKVYVISEVDDNNAVVMAQFNSASPPNYWLYAKGRDFYFLCNDFQTYLRMAIAHLGVAGWQLSAIDGTYSERACEAFNLLAPGFLEKTIEVDEGECNFLDANVFEPGYEFKPAVEPFMPIFGLKSHVHKTKKNKKVK